MEWFISCLCDTLNAIKEAYETDEEYHVVPALATLATEIAYLIRDNPRLVKNRRLEIIYGFKEWIFIDDATLYKMHFIILCALTEFRAGKFFCILF